MFVTITLKHCHCWIRASSTLQEWEGGECELAACRLFVYQPTAFHIISKSLSTFLKLGNYKHNSGGLPPPDTSEGLCNTGLTPAWHSELWNRPVRGASPGTAPSCPEGCTHLCSLHGSPGLWVCKPQSSTSPSFWTESKPAWGYPSRERQRRKESQGQIFLCELAHPAFSENPTSSQHFFHQLRTVFKADYINIFHIPFYPFFFLHVWFPYRWQLCYQWFHL